jgi:hypothetical protein
LDIANLKFSNRDKRVNFGALRFIPWKAHEQPQGTQEAARRQQEQRNGVVSDKEATKTLNQNLRLDKKSSRKPNQAIFTR